MEGDIKEPRAKKNQCKKKLMQLQDEALTEMAEGQPGKEEVQARYREVNDLFEMYIYANKQVKEVLDNYKFQERSLAMDHEAERINELVQVLSNYTVEYTIRLEQDEGRQHAEAAQRHDEKREQEGSVSAGVSMHKRAVSDLQSAMHDMENMDTMLRGTHIDEDKVHQPRREETPRHVQGAAFNPAYASTPTSTQWADFRERMRVLGEKGKKDMFDTPGRQRNQQHLPEARDRNDVTRGKPAEPGQARDRNFLEPKPVSAHHREFIPQSRDKEQDRNYSLRQLEYTEPSCYQEFRAREHHNINPLARMSVPTFSGNKYDFEGWWSDFMGMVHASSIPTHQKMMRLRRAVEGPALRLVQGLGDSEFSYEVALDALWERYGGQRRQLHLRYEDVEKMRPIREGSYQELEKLFESINILVVKLKEVGQDKELEDGILYINLQRKLPPGMLTRYFQWTSDNGYGESVIALRKFLAQEARNLAKAEETSRGFSQDGARKDDRPRREDRPRRDDRPRHDNRANTLVTSTPQGGARPRTDDRCRMCDQAHGAWRCQDFLKLSVSGRWAKAKEHHLCFRCLATQHRGEACGQSRRCGVDGCQNTHHRLLHDERGKRQPNSGRPDAGGKGGARGPEGGAHAAPDKSGGADVRTHTARHCNTQQEHGSFVALRTVPVIIRYGGKSIKVHALLDDASTKTYLNDDVAKLLDMQEEPMSLSVNTLNNARTELCTSEVQFKIQSVDGSFDQDAVAYTTTRVTGQMKVMDWRKHAQKWPHLEPIKFQELGSRPIVDLLIGGELGECHTVRDEVKGKPGEPVARLTPFGWTCVGTVDMQAACDSTNFTFCAHDDKLLLAQLERHWSIEEPENCSIVSPDEKHADLVAASTISCVSGRYALGVPWKPDAVVPAVNYEMAKKRLCHTETKLMKDAQAAEMYCKNMADYETKGYIRRVTAEDDLARTRWLLAHFPVIKLDRTTTKLRVVYDGAARYRGVSLNDMMLPGPKLQADLVHVLTRFRRKAIAIACDIQEMYMQIEMLEGDRVYHRFLWRDLDTTKKMEVYEFLCWVFGNRASPFGAHYISRHNAKKHQAELPVAAQTVLESTYMDDSMDSVNTVKEGRVMYEQLVELWSRASMKARKWISNSRELLKTIPDGELNACVNLDDEDLPQLKTLGVMWNTAEDVFLCKAAVVDDVPATKRQLLSKTATLFDPMGFFCPVTIIARVLLQRIWMQGLTWDQPLTDDIQSSVNDWFLSLPKLEKLHIPRACQRPETPVSTQVHIFTDASLGAYGGVAYLRQVYASGEIDVHLMMAKAKVAPTTAMSVPRLELMGAVVGIRLATKLKRVYGVTDVTYKYWSDSTDVLYWVRGQSRRFKPFVSNRVGHIQRESDPADWQHIATLDNPADILSRGMEVQDLCTSRMWLQGPEYLGKPEDEWPACRSEFASKNKSEEKTDKAYMCVKAEVSAVARPVTVTRLEELRLDPGRYSNLSRLLHVHAYVSRFVDNCRAGIAIRKGNLKPDVAPRSGALGPDELADVENVIIAYAQRLEFAEEIAALGKGDAVKVGSRLAALCPWLDMNNVLRMNSRLKNADGLSWDAKHPIILPRTGAVTTLYVRRAHEESGHGGSNRTLAYLAGSTWIVSGREAIRAWERQCMTCKRRKARPGEQLMAPLPAARVSVSRKAFDHTTLDFAGPFHTKQGRGKARAKRYMCIFTCMATRAVHLEIVYSMSTDAFLNAFTRMADRRGCPTYVVSANGSNFVGAEREVRRLVNEMDKHRVQHVTSARGVTWNFNPPAAPHFNGVHEALVKSAKRALKHTLPGAEFNDEELMSAFTGAEKLLNGRPLTYQSANPQDWAPLTPNNFLVGHTLVDFPPRNVDTSTYSLSNRWRHVQSVLRHFWRRWMTELLPMLGVRAKWRRERRDTTVGDVVMVMSPDTPRGQWPLARVEAVYPGPDGHVRAVDVRTKDGVYRRPIVKICALEDSC